MGRWDICHPTLGIILQNYLRYILKFPTQESGVRSVKQNGQNAVTSVVVQTQLHQGPDTSPNH